MERWNNRVAVVTGASSGIGAAIALELVKSGVIVAGLARRVERIVELKAQLPVNLRLNLHAVKCDVGNDESVEKAFDWVEQKLGGIDILVNNAGIVKIGQIVSMDLEDMQQVMQVNVFGIIRCVRRAFKSMKERNVAGHVINVNSVLGHQVIVSPGSPPQSNLYAPSKFAVTALTEILALEFKYAETKVKITSLSPGIVDTDIVPESYRKAVKEILSADDIAQAVRFTLGTPENVQIKELTVKPLGGLF